MPTLTKIDVKAIRRALYDLISRDGRFSEIAWKEGVRSLHLLQENPVGSVYVDPGAEGTQTPWTIPDARELGFGIGVSAIWKNEDIGQAEADRDDALADLMTLFQEQIDLGRPEVIALTSRFSVVTSEDGKWARFDARLNVVARA